MNQISERSILFNPCNVQKIIQRTKIQTRRIILPQPVEHDFGPGGVQFSFVAPNCGSGYLDNLHIIAIDVPKQFIPSPYVRVMRMAEEEMKTTGYFTAGRRIHRVLKEGILLRDVE
jgi:hypothetical protein